MTTRAWKTMAFTGATAMTAIVALAGCAGTGTDRAEPNATHSSSAVGAASATDSSNASGPASAAAGGGDASSAPGAGSLRSSACTATHLHGSLTATPGGGSAGHQGYELVFRNTGSSPCTLQGWPGVSFVGKGNGTQLGAPATFDRSSAHGTVTVAAGSLAHATVLVAQAQDYGDCGIATADGFRVYPPGSKQSLFIDAGQLELSACTASNVQQLQVQAIQPGS